LHTEILYVFFISPYFPCLTIRYLVWLLIFCNEYKLWSFSLFNLMFS
jgi:hypothetical protein